MRKVKNQVFQTLKEYEITRDCDKMLFLAIMAKYYRLKEFLGDDHYRKFRMWFLHENIPSVESIRRCRQKWQEEGHFVGEKRQKKLEEADRTKTFIQRGFYE